MNFTDKTKKNKTETVYHRAFGRRYIIESPDILLERYEKAKKEKNDEKEENEKKLKMEDQIN